MEDIDSLNSDEGDSQELEGIQSELEVMQSEFEGVQSESQGIQSESEGIQSESEGIQSESVVDVNSDTTRASYNENRDIDSESEFSSDKDTIEEKDSYERLLIEIEENDVASQLYKEVIHTAGTLGYVDDSYIDWGPTSIEYFVLPSDLWVEWLHAKMTDNPELNPDAVKCLYERALYDFPSLNLWRSYLKFAVHNMVYPMDVSEVRRLFQRAVKEYGMHPVEGGALWKAYFEYESNILLCMKEHQNDKDFDPKAFKSQLERCISVFYDQLKWPLIDQPELYSDFLQWISTHNFHIPKSELSEIRERFAGSCERLENLITFEDALTACNENQKSAFYKAYIDKLVSAKEKPDIIRILFERATATSPKDVNLWRNYIRFLDREFKDNIFNACRKSVRCDPSSTELWVQYMFYAEKYSPCNDSLEKIFTDALKFSKKRPEHERAIRLANIECGFRHIRQQPEVTEADVAAVTQAIDNACHYLAENYGLRGDPQCVLLRLWARIEAAYIGNLEKSRLLWTDILSQGHDRKADMWLEYAALERSYGDHKHLRRLFARALNYRLDNPRRIEEAWTEFERDFGTWENVLFAQHRIEEKRNVVQKEKDIAEYESRHAKGAFKKPKPAKSHGQENKRLSKIKSQSHGSEKDDTKAHSQQSVSSQDKNQCVTKDCKAMHPECTVFLSNLPFTLTEDDIKDIFTPTGNVVGVKIEKGINDHSRGYGYVEFDSEVSCKVALQRDRELINGRPMFVSRYNPEREHREKGAPKYEMSMEKTKLFVKGLSFETTENDLKNLFSTYGDVKAVRVVLDKNGRSRGFAYVEFKNEKSASDAVEATDGNELHGHKITVAISNPTKASQGTKRSAPESEPYHPSQKKHMPQRNSNPETAKISLDSSLGAGTTHSSTGSRGRSRTQMSFVPRVLQVASTSNPTDTPAASDKKKLGNEDFRKMLLGSK